jgi:hypothetical protein
MALLLEVGTKLVTKGLNKTIKVELEILILLDAVDKSASVLTKENVIYQCSFTKCLLQTRPRPGNSSWPGEVHNFVLNKSN